MTSPSPGNEPPLFSLLSDHPIESDAEKCDDLLDLHERLRVHLDTLRHPGTRTPFSIALYGDWGTGKTSAMRWLECQLLIWNDSDVRDKDTHPHFTPVWFFPWKYHKREDVWRGIIAEVILATVKTGSKDAEDFSKKAVHVAKSYGKFLGSSFLHILANSKLRLRNKASLGVPGVAKNETTAGIELNGQAVRDIYDEYQKAAQPHAPFLNDFEEEMKHWVEQTFDDTSRRLVLFIDDLDRCLPEVALEVLEALKLYLNIPGLLFVAGLDDHVISQVIVSHYKKHEVDETKARQYLAKIFQVEYHMEPSDTKASGFLERRIRDLNQLTDGKWSECLPTAGPEVDERTVRYRPAVENALRALGSSNPREFTRLLNSLLVRAVAAREMKLADPETTPELRFAQGAQIFLIERFLIRHLDLGPARRNPLLSTHFCEWLEKLSALRRSDPGAEVYKKLTENESAAEYEDFKVTAAGKDSPTQGRMSGYISPPPSRIEEIKLLTTRTRHAQEAMHIIHEHAWDLLLIPFSPDIAAAAAITKPLPIKEAASTQDSDQIIDTEIRKELNISAWSEVPDERLKEITHLDLTAKEIKDVARLGRLKNLKSLSLSGTRVSDLKPLENLIHLQFLYLAGTLVVDLLPINNLAELRVISLSDTPIEDINPLQHLLMLEKVDIGGTKVSSIDVLKNLKNLQVVRLTGTPAAFDPAAIDSLERALPMTEIRYRPQP